MQPTDPPKRAFNIQTNMEAEILSFSDTEVTFRSLPVGRPATVPRAKFDTVFRFEGDTLSEALVNITQTMAQPNKAPKMMPKKAPRKAKKKKPKRRNIHKRTKKVRDSFVRAQRRRHYARHREKIAKKNLERYHKQKAEVAAGLRPPKMDRVALRALWRENARKYRASHPEEVRIYRAKWARAKRLRLAGASPASPPTPIPDPEYPANSEFPQFTVQNP
jgi:hypothetical protein